MNFIEFLIIFSASIHRNVNKIFGWLTDGARIKCIKLTDTLTAIPNSELTYEILFANNAEYRFYSFAYWSLTYPYERSLRVEAFNLRWQFRYLQRFCGY